jgi:hypothetical protein
MIQGPLTVIRSVDYDWIALYNADGQLLDQGHDIQEEALLQLLGYNVTHHVATYDQFNKWGGQAPERLPATIEEDS